MKNGRGRVAELYGEMDDALRALRVRAIALDDADIVRKVDTVSRLLVDLGIRIGFLFDELEQRDAQLDDS